jgi:hypothetical protein
VKERDAPVATVIPAKSADRLTVASERGYGAIRGIVNCAEAGVISAAALSELHEIYSCGVEPLLQTASLLQRTAVLVRHLVTAADLLRR